MTHVPDDTPTPGLPDPSRGARWRWATSRRALVGGGVVAAALSLGGVAAGASPAHSGKPPTSSQGPGRRPAGSTPTTAGKVTAVGSGSLTVQARGQSTQTVTYSSATTFRTMSGSTSASDLKVGEFVAVQGTKNADGSVAATTIMISTGPPGNPGPGHAGRPSGPRPAHAPPAA